jgi:hypothetical protein
MRRMTSGTTRTLISGLLVTGLLALTSAWSQTQDPLQDVEKRLSEKRTAAEIHRKQMEGIKDPDKLSTEMRRHFQMTEEVLALMLERQKLLKAQAPMSGMSSGQSGGMQGGGMMGHGMGMMQKEMGGMQGGSMQGGMMQKEMGGMQGSGTQGSGTQSGGMQGSGMHGGGMQGSAMSGQQAPSSPSGSATPSSDMAQMMQRITEHSAYMETLTDQATLTQEMLRHQKMLDEMLQLMQ